MLFPLNDEIDASDKHLDFRKGLSVMLAQGYCLHAKKG
jgi:hypothetical protein